MKRQATVLIASALLFSAPAFSQGTTTTTPTTPPAASTTPATPPAATTTPATPPAAATPAPGASTSPTTPAPGAATTTTGTATTTTTIMAPEGYTAVPDFSAVRGDELEGLKINGPSGDTIGEIAEIELGADGKVTGLIADIGGFLGMGEHRVKLGLDQIAVFRNADGKMVAVSDMTEEQLKALPEYEAPKT